MLRAGALNLEIESKWDSFEHFPIPEFRSPIRCSSLQRTFYNIQPPSPLSKNILLPGDHQSTEKNDVWFGWNDHVDELGGGQMNYNLGLDKNLDTRALFNTSRGNELLKAFMMTHKLWLKSIINLTYIEVEINAQTYRDGQRVGLDFNRW